MLIRILEAAGTAELVLPRRVPLAEGLQFAAENAAWIGRRLAALPPHVPFTEGAIVPIFDRPVGLRRTEASRGPIVRRDNLLHVPADEARFAQRVRAWFIAEARHEISERVLIMATRIDRRVKRISIRDPETRWGSCSTLGTLCFSWRLVMAPARVMDYVIAHEVAHLKAMHHGARFWSLVETLYGDPEPARLWLNENGLKLRRYG